MKALIIAMLAAVAITGCDGPATCDLDNHCIINYLDGTTEDIICSYAYDVKPDFRSVADGKIVILFHDMTTQCVPMKHVKSWRFRHGDTDHGGRFVKDGERWVRKP